ncbi:uncharacterized protein LOC119466705 [Cebus imitator]|uniref:uncharacterized protein LOC119466705 n=1 Tax=Cebus imitator TaxID=2715852 RepID=UPI001897C4F0|nr:uncharacterized protein LOC119466705 [Cebus imitator]
MGKVWCPSCPSGTMEQWQPMGMWSLGLGLPTAQSYPESVSASSTATSGGRRRESQHRGRPGLPAQVYTEHSVTQSREWRYSQPCPRPQQDTPGQASPKAKAGITFWSRGPRPSLPFSGANTTQSCPWPHLVPAISGGSPPWEYFHLLNGTCSYVRRPLSANMTLVRVLPPLKPCRRCNLGILGPRKRGPLPTRAPNVTSRHRGLLPFFLPQQELPLLSQALFWRLTLVPRECAPPPSLQQP